MATEGKEKNLYEGGTGGKFRKRPFRKTQTTPYDRPPAALRNPNSNNNGWISKLVDPAHRLITHGAHSLFSSLLRKRLPPPPPAPNSSGFHFHFFFLLSFVSIQLNVLLLTIRYCVF